MLIKYFQISIYILSEIRSLIDWSRINCVDSFVLVFLMFISTFQIFCISFISQLCTDLCVWNSFPLFCSSLVFLHNCTSDFYISSWITFSFSLNKIGKFSFYLEYPFQHRPLVFSFIIVLPRTFSFMRL